MNTIPQEVNIMKTTVMNVKSAAGFNFKMIMRAVGTAYITTLVFIAILAALLSWTGLPESFSAFGLILIAIISNIIGGIAIAKKMRSNGWINGAMGGICYVILLYFIAAVFYNSLAVTANTFVLLAICVFSGVIGGIIGVNSRSKR